MQGWAEAKAFRFHSLRNMPATSRRLRELVFSGPPHGGEERPYARRLSSRPCVHTSPSPDRRSVQEISDPERPSEPAGPTPPLVVGRNGVSKVYISTLGVSTRETRDKFPKNLSLCLSAGGAGDNDL